VTAQFNSNLVNLAEGEVIHSTIDPNQGIFVVLSGLIQVNNIIVFVLFAYKHFSIRLLYNVYYYHHFESSVT
jgi:hypothetical protein